MMRLDKFNPQSLRIEIAKLDQETGAQKVNYIRTKQLAHSRRVFLNLSI